MNKLNELSKELGYNYMYHFNEYTDQWAVFPREEFSNYFNGFTNNLTEIGYGHSIEVAIENLYLSRNLKLAEVNNESSFYQDWE